MKKIEAFIKRHRLDEVTRALRHVKGLTGMTVTDTRGFGRGRGRTATCPTAEMSYNFVETTRTEVFCADLLVEDVVTAIEKAAHTGLRGDGKVYVIPVEQAIRISTGERGQVAV